MFMKYRQMRAPLRAWRLRIEKETTARGFLFHINEWMKRSRYITGDNENRGDEANRKGRRHTQWSEVFGICVISLVCCCLVVLRAPKITRESRNESISLRQFWYLSYGTPVSVWRGQLIDWVKSFSGKKLWHLRCMCSECTYSSSSLRKSTI